MGVQIDETGNKYNHLLVLYKSNINKHNRIYWHCLCDCGNECDVDASSLRTGKTKSCGCLRAKKAAERQIKDLSNQRFGRLIALERTGEIRYGKSIWKCQCDCGNIVEVNSHNLIAGLTQSCGCINSHAEEIIAKLLKGLNIKYTRQYNFNDLRGIKNGKLRFDFAILSSKNELFGLIEYQGQQHFKSVAYWGGDEGFKQRQIYDKMKVDYCQQHQIPLLIINYDENIDDKIEQFLKELKLLE